MKISLIVAFDENRLIGRDNGLPWHLPADLKHFKTLTMGHHMIMGRKTYESIGKPLPGRTTVIITRQTDYLAEGCIVTQNFTEAMMQCAKRHTSRSLSQSPLFLRKEFRTSNRA
ncbi:MAG: dihydrofolate reductase [Bacteroidetes bacterium]|nr:dihydrofolate reductase [Bacteroidota bacterium]